MHASELFYSLLAACGRVVHERRSDTPAAPGVHSRHALHARPAGCRRAYPTKFTRGAEREGAAAGRRCDARRAKARSPFAGRSRMLVGSSPLVRRVIFPVLLATQTCQRDTVLLAPHPGAEESNSPLHMGSGTTGLRTSDTGARAVRRSGRAGRPGHYYCTLQQIPPCEKEWNEASSAAATRPHLGLPSLGRRCCPPCSHAHSGRRPGRG